MTFDYISDIHENFYTSQKGQSKFIENLFKEHSFGDYLIIAGDLSETVNRVVSFLSRLSKSTPYKEIFYIPGNHDLYKEKNLDTMELKYEALKRAVNEIKKVTFLDGQIIDLNGIKISGLSMYADTGYLRQYASHLNESQRQKEFLSLWYGFMLDSRKTNSDPLHFSAFLKKKLDIISEEKIDIFVSHFTPVTVDNYFAPQYRGSWTNTLFSFGGLDILEKGNIKNWIYGHTHTPFQGEIYETKLWCNPLGYPGENYTNKIESISLNNNTQQFHKK